MKTIHPSSDPLLRSLTDDAADLPVHAAIQARRITAKRRQYRQRSALLATASLIGIITWTAWTKVPKRSPASDTIAEIHTIKPPVLEKLPTGLDPQQMAFVKAAGDIPLLLVRNSSGKVTRIHLIER